MAKKGIDDHGQGVGSPRGAGMHALGGNRRAVGRGRWRPSLRGPDRRSGCRVVEGNMIFHTALSTAFPQPAPGSAPSPGPMVVPSDQLRSMLGLSTVAVLQGNKALAFVDKTLAG
jgi:hypothetical protein